MLFCLEEKIIDNYLSNKKKYIYHVLRKKKKKLLIPLYKLNLPSDEEKTLP